MASPAGSGPSRTATVITVVSLGMNGSSASRPDTTKTMSHNHGESSAPCNVVVSWCNRSNTGQPAAISRHRAPGRLGERPPVAHREQHGVRVDPQREFASRRHPVQARRQGVVAD